MNMQSVVFASSNIGKIRELDALLQPLGYTVLSQDQWDIQPVEENALTFVENALLKARQACHIAGLPAIADDSGLEVDALSGAPGLYSARYAEMHHAGSGDTANNALLLDQLKHLPTPEQRRARFRSVVVYLRHAKDPAPLIAQGQWEGHILLQPEGDGGFGYDPVFCNHDTHSAAALLDKTTKNQLSHRGQAIRQLITSLRDVRTHHSG